MDMAELLEVAEALLRRYPLCDSCLGRQFAMLGSNLSNEERGFSIKTLLMMNLDRERGLSEDNKELLIALARSGHNPSIEYLKSKGIDVEQIPCYICRGLLEHIPRLVRKALEKLKHYEFNTFLVGSKVPEEVLNREERLRAEYKLDRGESIKAEINRRAGKLIREATGKEVDFSEPDIIVTLDFGLMDVEVLPSPIFIYGRYRKLSRSISQCRWLCPRCRGVGCRYCKMTGKRRLLSIEEAIGSVILKYALGDDVKFHGAGREDVDVRMLGNGRPFVIEVVRPKIRNLDLDRISIEINYRCRGIVEVMDLKFVPRDFVKKLKASAEVRPKVYKALVKVDNELEMDKLSLLERMFKERIIRQRTPLRVLHRRADKVRIKRVDWVKPRMLTSRRVFEALVKCQGGLYVKELISGDKGRTSPSFSEVLGTNARCIRLDVLKVEG
ncbi:MAG: tRNA pseudouridine(54/55) synthase Pus10 [Thermoprotei archaeon]|nr:MAG: tRNA pseudouridine(54/55) synthase Pus10 [Thermoprotei archaeon]